MVGPPIRPAYNAKARKSTSGSRKKGKAKMQHSDTEKEDTNIDILVLRSNEDKDKKRKENLLKQLASQSESKWTSKKKKRSEKYIEKKLKKEDRLLLFEKLAQSQASISSNRLRSSFTLGTNKLVTDFEVDEDTVFMTSQKRKRRQASSEESDIDISDGPKCVLEPSLEQPSRSGPIRDAPKRHLERSVPHRTDKKSARGWSKRGRPEVDETSASFDSSNFTDEDGNISETETKQEEPVSIPGKRSSGFKYWALHQLRKAKGNDLDVIDHSVEAESLLPNKKRKTEDHEPDGVLHGPLGESLEMPSTSFAQRVMDSGRKNSLHVKVVEVKRPPEVENARLLLPIITEEQVVMETILLNPVVIICGETGSGKTTQVPQFLYEAGFGTPGSENPGMIGITQPRRVAAVAMAQRVGHELSLNSARVSYQIRYDATVSPNTSIKFMTDGVLLRELAVDFLLAKYSVIIIDEVHERNINTDILIGVLSRVIKLREDLWRQEKNDIKPLRLVIMSATLRTSDFSENNLFSSPPPVIDIAARQHSVTIHFSRRTHTDYITRAINKTVQIHRRLPPGGILVFLTGQSDIVGVCKRLEAKFSRNAMKERQERHSGVADSIDDSAVSFRSLAVSQAPLEVEDFGLHDELDDNIDSGEHSNEEGDESQEDNDLEQELGVNLDMPMHVVPLYSLLPSEKQLRVFEPPPPNCRLVVISTNIAETSLTIPGIRYVVDCGRVKERHYDAASGVQSFHISWISKASSAQRAGRAGRTGPGHCYRLYSSAFYEDHFDSFSMPEIQRMPIEGVVLQMKSMGIDTVINFPFPTPPDRQALHKAERILTYLGALRPSQSKNEGGPITELGHAMSLFPLSPRFSRMLVTSQQHGCLPYAICIVSGLAVGDPFTSMETLENEVSDSEEASAGLQSKPNQKEAGQLRKVFYDSHRIHAALGNYTSDLFKYLSVIGAYGYASGTLEFCTKNFVRPKMMQEIHNLRAQISDIVAATFPGTDTNLGVRLTPPSDRQVNALRQILTAGFLDQTAVRKDIVEKKRSGTRFTTSRGIPYRALGVSEDVYLHPSSILIDSAPPAYLVFNEIVRTSKIFLKGLTVVNPAWLSTLGKDTLCSFSKPVKNNLGVFMTVPMFGPDRWELPAIKVNTE